MARSIWSGAIVFAMVSIPVKLYGATEDKDLAFTTLHKDCNSRLKQKRWCPVHEREVFTEEIERVYEYAKNDYVPVTEQDLESLPVPSKKTIEIGSFVSAADLDPVYFEKSYNVEPEAVGMKPYALVLQALRTNGVAAVAKIALRNKESLCLLRAGAGNVMVLSTLYYPDEVRSLQLPDVLIAPAELAMATNLVEMMRVTFDPSQYRDQYRESLLTMIQAKHNGEAIVTAPQLAAPAPTMDMMAALQASLNAQRNRRAAVDLSEQDVAI